MYNTRAARAPRFSVKIALKSCLKVMPEFPKGSTFSSGVHETVVATKHKSSPPDRRERPLAILTLRLHLGQYIGRGACDDFMRATSTRILTCQPRRRLSSRQRTKNASGDHHHLSDRQHFLQLSVCAQRGAIGRCCHRCVPVLV